MSLPYVCVASDFLLVDVSDEMPPPVVDDTENFASLNTQSLGVATAPNSPTRWIKRRNLPNLPNIWAEKKSNSNSTADPPKYGDTSATYWKLYGSEAEIYDENFIESLKGNTGSMVFLNTLFSAIVAVFIIEIYKTLLPSNTGDGPSNTALRINIVLFLSFFLSVMSAVGCALVQQWCDEYKKFAYPRAAPHARGRVRTYLYRGLKDFQMRRFVYGIHVLLHFSVFLFFWALSDFFYTVNHHFGTIAHYALVGSVIIYMLFSVSPLIFTNSPYHTPMTPPLRAACIILLIIIRFPLWFPHFIRRRPFDLTGLQHYDGIHFDRERLYSIEAAKRAKKLEPYAMKWLFTSNDFSDGDMDKFLEGLPGYMSSNHTEKDQMDEYITAEHIKWRIKQHFITCATSVELSDEACIARASSCVNALVLIFEYNRRHNSGSDKLEKEVHLQRTYIQELIGDFQTLCGINNHTAALRASCISALAVQGLLSHLIPPISRTTDSSHFPESLTPIYDYLFLNNDTVAVPQLGNSPTPSAREMWKSLLHDGPLANLSRLAKAIRGQEHVSPSTLSFCWKILDILLPRLGTILSDKPTRAQKDFDDLHEDTRKYVHGGEMGYCMTPLLEILDAVARGRRLLMVFSGHAEYHSRASVVFGKEYLQNGDLLEAFAHCLPHFIANHPHDVCMDLMEKVVCRDDLWSNLQMFLWTRERSISSASDKFRVFECCCNVLNVAFSVLEDSQEVDWRAPEFGSLWQQFESFVTHGFQGAFMGRATSFRFGLIKARFCKVLLAQFRDDIIQKNILSFRSQWDVASLAKLIYYLGLQDKDDPEFWNSYFNGGHIGTKVTEKAHEMVDIVASDGPLSIFCQLGHLATSTIPSHHSDLDRKDIEKVLELQDRLMADQQMPLNQASDAFWKDLHRLREQVKGLCGATTRDTGSTGGKGESLHPLLQRIDDVLNRRPEGPSRHNGHADEQPSADPDSPRVEVNGGSPSSTQTIETSEGEFEKPESHATSPFQTTVHSTLQVDTSSIFRAKGSSPSPRSPSPLPEPLATRLNLHQSVTFAPRKNTLIAVANPMISLPPSFAKIDSAHFL